jgi:hypothetical protein
MQLLSPSGEFIRAERLRAFSDQDAIDAAWERLRTAAMIAVWASDRWVCQLHRRAALH